MIRHSICRRGRAALSVAAAACIALAGACSSFARNTLTALPPEPIGKLIVSGRDSSVLFSTPSYTLIAPSYSAVWDTKLVLEDIGLQFHRLFGEDPPPIAVVLRDSVRGRPGMDSTWSVPSVTLIVPTRNAQQTEQDHRRGGGGTVFLIARRLTPPAAHAWIEAYTGRLAVSPTPGRAELPPWFDTGLERLLIAPEARDIAVASLQRRPNDILPLSALFVHAREGLPNLPNTDGSPLGPTQLPNDPRGPGGMTGTGAYGSRRPGDGPSYRGASMSSSPFASQSTAFVAYMFERGGAPAMSALVAGLGSGKGVLESLAARKELKSPTDLDVLEADWRKWLKVKAQNATNSGDSRRRP